MQGAQCKPKGADVGRRADLLRGLAPIAGARSQRKKHGVFPFARCRHRNVRARLDLYPLLPREAQVKTLPWPPSGGPA
jgi:hypothetical protein